MALDPTHLIFSIGLLIFIGYFLHRLFEQTRIPDVFFLILIGITAGPVLHLISPDDFGSLGPVFAVATAIIILFEGGHSIRLQSIRDSLPEATALTMASFLATVLVSAVFCHYLLFFDWMIALMFGAIIGGTGSAIVIPVMRQMCISTQTKTILILESAVTDVLCIIAFMTLYQIYLLDNFSPVWTGIQLILTFGVALIAGVSSGILWAVYTRRFRHYSSLFVTPAFVFIMYAVVESLGFSGFIAVISMGITLGNPDFFAARFMNKQSDSTEVALTKKEQFFINEMVFIMKTFFFLYIGLSISLKTVDILVAALFITILLLIIRIPVTWVSIPRIYSRKDAAVISVTIPKGLAAAVLATLLIADTIPGSYIVSELIYGVILFSILLHAVMTFLVETRTIGGFYSWLFSSYSTEPMEDDICLFREKLPFQLPSLYSRDIEGIYPDKPPGNDSGEEDEW